MRAFAVVDLGYGDAGKGSLVDYLVRTYGATEVIRYNGGAQAAHNVVEASGRAHTFAQFGSGMLVPGVRTHLSRYMLVNPVNLVNEVEGLRMVGVHDAIERLSIDYLALVTTPFHVAANRLREMARGDGRHGSCGLGIGETRADALEGHEFFAAHFYMRPDRMRRRLRQIQERKREEIHSLLPDIPDWPEAREAIDALINPQVVDDFATICEQLAIRGVVVMDHEFESTVVFEGAQGVLLDESWGFQPYTTWSDTTLTNVHKLLRGVDCDLVSIGVCRAYMTRHGPGPLVTESYDLSVAMPDDHNGFNEWQREFRVGYTDLVALRYARGIAGWLDGLAVTCVDRVEDYVSRMRAEGSALRPWKVCSGYRYSLGGVIGQIPMLRDSEKNTRMLERCDPIYDEVRPGEVPELIARALGLPLMITSHGPTAEDKAGVSAVLA